MARAPQNRPIPMPWSIRWRVVRERLLPVILFVLVVTAIAHLWRNHFQPIALQGSAEQVRAAITTPQGGQLVRLHVAPYARVQQGQPIAEIMTAPLDLLQARLAVVQAEATLLALTQEPVTGKLRADLDYEGLRVEWMQQRIERAIATTRLTAAESEYQRVRRLHAEELVADAEYEEAKAQRDTLVAQRDGSAALIQALEGRLKQLRPASMEEDAVMSAALEVQHERLRLIEAEMAPVVLYAPIDGVIGPLPRQTGEIVLAGDQIGTVMSETAVQAVAYLREPIQTQPEEGQPVQITSASRHTGQGSVIHVSPQIETLPDRWQHPGLRPQRGLRIIVRLPPDLQVVPGETLDLVLYN